jgi:hypothetical protein
MSGAALLRSRSKLKVRFAREVALPTKPHFDQARTSRLPLDCRGARFTPGQLSTGLRPDLGRTAPFTDQRNWHFREAARCLKLDVTDVDHHLRITLDGKRKRQ